GVLVEIDQHVATEDEIERAERAEIVQQIERTELHHGTDVRRDLPTVTDLREIFDQELDRQSALDFELAVDAGLGLLEHLGRDVGGQKVDAPAVDVLARLLN